ncbi:hypothetical protein RND81_03G008300 [Saponaria officinalis]|uniref:SWIM-type domain-containing protein n=1 Tax=Saponaria officinalis TaxID=3572 RepID=A0AAW1M4C3_SAPOF
MVVSGIADFVEGVDITSNENPSTPLARPTSLEKHTPPILLSYSPKGSQQWIRKVEEDFMPRIGMEFDTLEDGIQFYRIYAIACGFDIRKSTQKRFRDQTMRTKVLLCHREGFGESKKTKNMVSMEPNESAFGDGVSFDPTYGTNRYCMVLTPFTGIDNHKKSVTFACTLLSNEDEESFVWVFQKFMEAMGRKEPQIIITDQDPAIRNSVPVVFKTARHRFCMWHIMKKVPDKIDIITCKDTDFLSRLNGIVWNKELDPTDFDDKWNDVITEFGLEDNRWLSTMFDMKEYWIPAYFRDLHMGDIMSTTQRSESENSFFKKFENHYGTVIEFWLRYESAMDQQRHTHKLYTHEVFYEIQEEIKSSMCGCGLVGYSRSASVELSDIEDSEKKKTFSVKYNVMTSEVLCTCKLFERRGLICRHIFWVFSNKLLRIIPEKYIMSRWSKDALRGPVYDLDGNIIQNYDAADECQLEMSKVWSEFYNVISMVTNKELDTLRNLQRVLKEFKETIEPTNERLSKQQEMEMLIGCNVTNEVRILPPRQSKNKGSVKRMVTSKTKAIEKAKKPKRRCGNCKRMSYHDSRNCEEPFAKHPPEEEGISDE